MRILPAQDPDDMVISVCIPQRDAREAAAAALTSLEQLCLAEVDVARPAAERIDGGDRRGGSPRIDAAASTAIGAACELLAFRTSGGRRVPSGLVALAHGLDAHDKTCGTEYLHARHGTDLITTNEAARRLNISARQVRRRAVRGELRGERVGKQWLIRADGLPEAP